MHDSRTLGQDETRVHAVARDQFLATWLATVEDVMVQFDDGKHLVDARQTILVRVRRGWYILPQSDCEFAFDGEVRVIGARQPRPR